jgi:hypothetical protein
VHYGVLGGIDEMGSEAVTSFCGREVSEADVALMREVVVQCNGLSRMELAATVCELLGWTRAGGSVKARECRELLEELEASGILSLPEKRAGRPRGSRTQVPVTDRGEPGLELTGTVRDVGPISVERVTTEDERLLWRELVGRYHYLGHAVPYGAQLRYLVWAHQPERVVVGCVQLSSPAWRMAARDGWVGWTDAARARGLQRVVCNSRFLILPWVKVRNLASATLAATARRVAEDWPRQYGVEPYLLETLVDTERFAGTCYRAAGWVELGSTTGRGRMDREHRREGLSPKTVFVYPLVREAAAKLREL